MTIKLEIRENNMLVVRASAVLTRSESNEVKKEIVAIIKKQGKINVLVIIDEDFSNLEAFVKWDDDHHDTFIQQNTNRLAIVGHLKWYEDAMLFFLDGLVPFTIEYFKVGQEELAMAWLLQ